MNLTKKETTCWRSIVLATLLITPWASFADAETNSRIQQLEAQLLQQQQRLDALADTLSNASNNDAGKITWGGYGVITYQEFDFYENAQDDSSEARATTDLERIVLAPRVDLGNGFYFIGEIEFEHGGTGTTLEFEPEEAGEFESEVEKGGEVVLEQAYLLVDRHPRFKWRIGEILVPFGMVNSHHDPTAYFSLRRSWAESSVIPSVWHETGVALFGSVGKISYEAQIITALDSSGFSGFGFVSQGTQGKFESDNADDLALIARVDYELGPSDLIGASFYIGDSSGNRPRKNLAENARVTLYEMHGRVENEVFALRAQYLEGTIENSDAVTQSNLSFFQRGLVGVSGTAVGHKAKAWFVEAGYDLFSLAEIFPGKLFGFLRVEGFDTHADVEGNVLKVDRYDREATTVGLNYFPQRDIVVKAEFARLENAGTVADQQDFFGLSLGFEF